MMDREERTEEKSSQILDTFQNKNAVFTILKNDGSYAVTSSKRIFRLFDRNKSYEFDNYSDAVDKFLELNCRLYFSIKFW